MAVSTKIKSQLQIVLDGGLDEAGKPVFKNKNLNNIKTTATPDQLLAIATVLVNLQTKPLVSIELNDSSVIMS